MGRLLALLATVIAIGTGIIVLLGLVTQLPLISVITAALLQLVLVTAGLTVLIGVLNLLTVHLGRVFGRRRGWVYSLFLVLSLLLVIILTAAERLNLVSAGAEDPSYSMIVLETVQVSLESALAGLLVFALVYGAYRLMRHRVSFWRVLFTLSLLVILIGALPLTQLGFMQEARDWLLTVPVSAGARGILLGIALATVVTGIRVLIGQERSYRE